MLAVLLLAVPAGAAPATGNLAWRNSSGLDATVAVRAVAGPPCACALRVQRRDLTTPGARDAVYLAAPGQAGEDPGPGANLAAELRFPRGATLYVKFLRDPLEVFDKELVFSLGPDGAARTAVVRLRGEPGAGVVAQVEAGSFVAVDQGRVQAPGLPPEPDECLALTLTPPVPAPSLARIK